MYFNKEGRLRSMPVSWTDLANEDDFQCASAGRSWFRLDDLLELSILVSAIKQTRRSVK